MSGTGGDTPGSNGIINSAYILPATPFVNPKTGIITPVWWRFLITLLARTGGPPGVITADVELVNTLQTLIDPDAPVDLSEVLTALREDGSDLAGLIAADVALALAVQTVGGDEAPEDGLATALVIPDPAATDDALPWLGEDPVALVDAWDWSAEAATNVAAGTYTLKGWAPFAGSITALRAVVGPAAVGSLTETVKINGVAVGGISAVTVNAATVQTFPATGGNGFIQGDLVQLTVAIAGGTPVGARSTVQYTRIPQ